MINAAWTAYWKGLLKLLLFMPALLLYKSWIGAEQHLLLWTGILSLFYVGGFLFRAYWPTTTKGLYGFVSILIVAAAGLLFFGASFAGWMQTALAAFIFFRGGFLVVIGWGEPVSPNLYWVSLFLYFISSIFYRFYEVSAHLVPLVNGFGIAVLLITMFAVNRYLLAEASLRTNQEKFKPAASLVFSNIKIMSALGILILLIGSSGFFGRIWGWIWDRIRITSGSQQGGAAIGGEPLDSDPLGSRGAREDPAAWLQILDIALQVVGVIALIALTAAFIYYIFKKSLAFVVRVWRYLRKKIYGGGDEAQSEKESAYTEEQKSLWEWERIIRRPGSLTERFKRNKKERWHALQSNGERVRFLFREWISQLMKNGMLYRKQDTPAEFARNYNLDDWKEFVQLYYRVRYGHYQPSDEEVLSWKNRIDA